MTPIPTTTMKAMKMPEPTSSSTAAGIAGWKLIGGAAGAAAIGAGLASIVVMCMTPPRSTREWAVGLISTVIGSIGGGAAVIVHFDLLAWTHSIIGLVAVLGLVFACGLPAWALVRWIFNFILARQGHDIADVAGEVRDVITGKGSQP